ncbi:MAG: hypothetical protein QF685_01675 [Verrucomicrobiota bacterium]|jgi:hypothetical protein|nr:hypothetical protein [Verrucomicrobiota bacterium]
MIENSLAHLCPAQAVDRLAEALRNELLEYGHLLQLLRAQQRMVLKENLVELTGNINAVNQQMRQIDISRKQREYWREETLCWLEADADLPWGQMRELLPEKHQILIQALVDEINLSLDSIYELLRQNQQLNLPVLILR